MTKSFKQSSFIICRPSVIIIYIPAEIWRIAIYQIAPLSSLYGLQEIIVVKFPMEAVHFSTYRNYLVANFGDISRRESIGLFAKRYIPFSSLVKSHHPIESRTGKKYKIKRTMVFIETISDKPVMSISILFSVCQQFTFMNKVSTHIFRSNFTIKHCIVKADDMRVSVANYTLAAHRGVEPNHSCTEKRLNPISMSQV